MKRNNHRMYATGNVSGNDNFLRGLRRKLRQWDLTTALPQAAHMYERDQDFCWRWWEIIPGPLPSQTAMPSEPYPAAQFHGRLVGSNSGSIRFPITTRFPRSRSKQRVRHRENHSSAEESSTFVIGIYRTADLWIAENSPIRS
jgi:hypothetical protein